LSLNYKEIDALLNEANLTGAFFQEIIQYDFHHLIFQFYDPQNREEKMLLVSLKPGSLRIHLTPRKRKALAKPPRFTAYMKSHVKGARLRDISQWKQERIISMFFTKGDAQFHLYIKLWENNSNLILTDEKHQILDCFSRRPKRKEIPGNSWHPEQIESRPAPEVEIREFPDAPSLNQQVELFYKEKERSGRLDQLKKEALPLIESEINSLQRQLKQIQKDQQKQDNHRLQHQGDLIMAHLHFIQKGDLWLDCEDQGERIRIQLDPKLEPWANGERYYQRSKKLKRKMAQQNPDELEEQIEKCRDQLHLFEHTDNPEIMEKWLRENKARLKKQKEPTTGLRFHSRGFEILIGRNARENDELLRKQVRGNDTWLHSRDYPGGYVFIRCPRGKTIPLDVLLDAGNLALHYSKAREEEKLDMHYTQVKYLRRVKNGPRGLVIPTQEKNLLIQRDDQRLQKILDGGKP